MMSMAVCLFLLVGPLIAAQFPLEVLRIFHSANCPPLHGPKSTLKMKQYETSAYAKCLRVCVYTYTR